MNKNCIIPEEQFDPFYCDSEGMCDTISEEGDKSCHCNKSCQYHKDYKKNKELKNIIEDK